MVISLNRSYESKVVAVLSSDSRFLRSATVRISHPHCYSNIRIEIRTASEPSAPTLQCVRTVLRHFLCYQRLHQDPCGCIDIRVFARILTKNLLYHFFIGAHPENPSTYSVRPYRKPCVRTAHFSSVFFIFLHFLQVKTKQTQ